MARKGTNILNDAGEMDKKITPSPSKPVVHFDTKARGLSVEELTVNWPIKKSLTWKKSLQLRDYLLLH